MHYTSTSLWKRTLAPRDNDEFEDPRTRLRSRYVSMRSNVSALVAQIQTSIPQLTVHDVSHLDALWRIADLIAGPEYPITPIEAFVFGASVLLHDAGLAVATVEGGLHGLKASPEWRDAAVAALETSPGTVITEEIIANPPHHLFDDIVFAVLRMLHGRLAEKMAYLQVTNPVTSVSVQLLEDNGLRDKYGELIGLLAASYNWEPEDLTQLQRHLGATGDLPAGWSIDPMKIGCLLRCADAGHIDQQRAPDFLFALLKLRGISRQHWLAQNRLAQPIQDPDDKQALLYTSLGSYPEENADAWWIAKDLISIVNKELKACDTLLRDNRKPVFAINRVRDADLPARLMQHISASGWIPLEAEVRVTEAKQVAQTLGGTALYGDNAVVPLRELIQNAADAVRARRYFDASNDAFRGWVEVRLRRKQHEGRSEIWLDVEDNGIGMSETVLTGPLLDFGTTLWRSSLVASEFPGLRGCNWYTAGKYGIGFYSIFTIADAVQVTSRRFDSGFDMI